MCTSCSVGQLALRLFSAKEQGVLEGLQALLLQNSVQLAQHCLHLRDLCCYLSCRCRISNAPLPYLRTKAQLSLKQVTVQLATTKSTRISCCPNDT